MPQQLPENVVFQGGGAKGPLEVFAYLDLVERGQLDPHQVKAYAGTSAGAIASTLFAFGTKPQEALDLMHKTDFSSFLDGKTINWAISRSKEGLKWYKALPDIIHAHQAYKKISKDHGLASGDTFRAWIEAQIKESVKGTRFEGKKNITFADLHELAQTQPVAGRHFADLKVVVSNLNRQKSETLSYETSPNACVADAVRASMSIPFVYKPWHRFDVNEQGERVQVGTDDYIDGGLHTEDNYPINAFDENGVRNPRTIGFCMMSPEHYAAAELHGGEIHKDTQSAADFFGATLSMLEDSEGTDGRPQSPAKQLWADPRSVRLSTDGVGTLDFGLTVEQYAMMQAHGQIGAQEYAERMGKSSMEDQLSTYVAKVEPTVSKVQSDNERLAKENAALRAEIEALKQATVISQAMTSVNQALAQHVAVSSGNPVKATAQPVVARSTFISLFSHHNKAKELAREEQMGMAAPAA